jgi:hypothetical protein
VKIIREDDIDTDYDNGDEYSESYDIDVLLDKISKNGIKSLTEQEREFLDKKLVEYKYDGIKQNISRRLTRIIKELPDNSVDFVITSPLLQ